MSEGLLANNATKYCLSCGYQLPLEAKWCSECGKKQVAEVVAPPAPLSYDAKTNVEGVVIREVRLPADIRQCQNTGCRRHTTSRCHQCSKWMCQGHLTTVRGLCCKYSMICPECYRKRCGVCVVMLIVICIVIIVFHFL
eukprot:UN10017